MRSIIQLLQCAQTALNAVFEVPDGVCAEWNYDGSPITGGIILLIIGVFRCCAFPFYLALKLVPPCEHPQLKIWNDYGGYDCAHCPDCGYHH